MSQENGWISLLLSGDRKAITYFTDNYGQFMYHVCYKVLLSTHDAEEAAQDAVLKAIKGLDRYDRSASLKAWCYTIAYRTAIDYKRRLKPTLSLEQSAEPILIA
ncbi:MAG: sigma-70 family RNA polymerase sigma factor [Saprospiraceae bacterium]|nr:sigma-70 family RNA polymerase sigma factor [Saprospiraceae bacterium]